MNTNILITGGAGFIGSHLCLKLLQKGANVTVLDNLLPQVHGNKPDDTSPSFRTIKSKVRFVKGSVASVPDLKKVIRNQDVVIHLAAETGTGQSMYKIPRYTKANVSGTANLLHVLSAGKHQVQKLLVASSRAVYGEGKYLSEELGYVYPGSRTDKNMNKGDFEVKYPGCTKSLQPAATDENSKLHPTSVYGITKQSQEYLVMTVCPKLGISPVALRYQNVYGPGQSLQNPYIGILSIFSNLIKNGKAINLYEDGAMCRDFVFIDDVVRATVMCAEREEADNEVFNVGSGVAVSLWELTEKLMTCLNKTVPVTVSGSYRLGDIRYNRADISKITSMLGFTPDISFQNGVKRFVDWVNTQEMPDNHFEDSIAEIKRKGMFK